MEREGGEKLRELKRRRENGKITGYIYERKRELLLGKIQCGFTRLTRARVKSLTPPLTKFIRISSSSSSESEEELLKFIDNRHLDELSTNTQTLESSHESLEESETHIILSESVDSQASYEPSLESSQLLSESSEEKTPMPLVIDCSLLGKRGEEREKRVIHIDWENQTYQTSTLVEEREKKRPKLGDM